MEEIKFDNIANKTDVLNRARKNLKAQDIYLTESQMESVYEAQVRYIWDKFRKSDKSTIHLPYIGTVYFPITYCNRLKNMYKHKVKHNYDDNIVNFKLWEGRAKEMDDWYQNNQTTKNSKQWHKFWHVIMPFRTRASIRGMKMHDLEELQNNIC